MTVDALVILFLIVCRIVTEWKHRPAARHPPTLAAISERPAVRPPILNVDLAAHHAIPVNQRLPQFPAPAYAELAALDVRQFQSLREPPRSPTTNVPQSSALGSPIQNAYHRLAHNTLSPTSPVLCTPPVSAIDDSARNLSPEQRSMCPLHTPWSVSRLNADPPHSPSATGLSSASTSPQKMSGLGIKAAVVSVKELILSSTSAVPQSQTITCEEPRMCPEILALPPAPVRNKAESLHQPQTSAVQRCPSFTAAIVTQLPAESGATQGSSSCDIHVSNGQDTSHATEKDRERSCEAIISSTPPCSSLATSDYSTPQNKCFDGQTAESPIVNPRVPFSNLHNTPLDIFSLDSPYLPPQLAALISPVKAPTHVDRRPTPVYNYEHKITAVAVANSIARVAQEDFKNFSVALGQKFEMKGWAENGANELAPQAKKNNKKKKAATAVHRISLLPAFEPASGN